MRGAGENSILVLTCSFRLPPCGVPLEFQHVSSFHEMKATVPLSNEMVWIPTLRPASCPSTSSFTTVHKHEDSWLHRKLTRLVPRALYVFLLSHESPIITPRLSTRRYGKAPFTVDNWTFPWTVDRSGHIHSPHTCGHRRPRHTQSG